MGNRIITLLMILMVAPLPLASIRNHNYRHSCRPIQAGLFPFWNKSSKSQKKNSLEDLKLNKDNNFFPNDEDPKKGPSGADVIHSGLTPNLSIVTGDPSTDPTTLYLSKHYTILTISLGDYEIFFHLTYKHFITPNDTFFTHFNSSNYLTYYQIANLIVGHVKIINVTRVRRRLIKSST